MFKPRPGETTVMMPPSSPRKIAAPASLDNLGTQRQLRLGGVRDIQEQAADREAEAFMAQHAQQTPRPSDYRRFFGEAAAEARVHTEAASERAADSLDARAFTVGADIHFARGRFDLHSHAGQRLLAHELAHVAQHRRDPSSRHTIRRQPNTGAGGPASSGLQVQTMPANEFAQMTGIDPDALPERQYVPASVALRSVGAGLALPPAVRMTNLSLNTTGVLWEGAHVSDFACVNGSMASVRGFRAELMRHILATGQRKNWPGFDFFGELLYPPGAGTTLNRGVRGSYAFDWLFPFNPRATAVYRTDPWVDPAGFADFMAASAPDMAGQTYTFSPPKPGTPAWDAAYGVDGTPPPTTNCVNVPLEQHRQALGLGPEEPVPFVPGENASGRFLDPVDQYFFGNEPLPPGLARTRIGPAMLGAGFIKAGGTVLLVYGAYNTATRIAEAQPGAETRLAISEEVGGWTGGLVGSALAEALGAVFICTGTGPGAFFCLAAVGMAGGAIGGTAGHALGHDTGEQLNTAIEILRDPAKMTEAGALIDSALTGSHSAQQYYETREGVTGEPSPWPF